LDPHAHATTDQADYFSTQVMRTRRFFLPEWEERQRDAGTLCLVGGGCEWCAPDFVVDRRKFPFLAFEFVSKAAWQRHAGRSNARTRGRARLCL
jgi:hypothetical protein